MLELWGGIECSVVRIRETYRNQVAETGHRDRPQDLDAVAALGITTLRYPVLFETVAPDDPDRCDWSWQDARFARLQRLGIRPIAGLTHHGSGPRYTSLLDPAFPSLLARYAGRVAARYPWIELFTPVNEPLTTARFAGLYGHWYPHTRREADFLRMVVNQCRATRLAMRAIRAVTPRARLIQTEDIGKTFSTPVLAAQAAYENERRWLSLDLLCGRVGPSHPWFARLIAHGIAPGELEEFLDGEGRPDLIGVNHYLTSERYLDENFAAYPAALHGGNRRRRYADVEAVRIRHLAGLTGPQARLEEVWERYPQPLAVTEVHHGCTRDDQLRWLAEVWNAALAVRDRGVPVRAVTLWSLFGAVDWNSLLLHRAGYYEPGAFDVRSPRPRPTALASAARELVAARPLSHPVLAAPGWWRRARRFYAAQTGETGRTSAPGRSVVILGEAGLYGAAIARICEARGLTPLVLGAEALPAALAEGRAWAVIDATTLPLAAAAKRYPGGSFRAGMRAGERVAGLCAGAGVPLLAFSSDLVFDGKTGRAALESDPIRPLGAYGLSEAEREACVLRAHAGALVVRTSVVFGLADRCDEAGRLLTDLSVGCLRRFVRPETISPTYLPDLIHAALDLLIDAETGVWHLVNAGETTWTGFAKRLALAAGLPLPGQASCLPEERRNTALASARGRVMPTLDSAVARYVETTLPHGPARIAAE